MAVASVVAQSRPQTVGSGTWQDIVNTLAAAGTPTTESEDAASGRIAALGVRMKFLRW